MNNTERLLRAFIEASGFEAEVVHREALIGEEPDVFLLDKNYCIDYKVTKKGSDEMGIIEWNNMTNSEKIMVMKENIRMLENENT